MGKPTRKDVKAEVKMWQELMGLQRWTITVRFAGVDTGDEAEVETDPDYYKATIRVNLDAVKSRKALRLAIVHEMLHIVLSPYTQYSRELVGKRKRKLLKRLEERLVSRMERWRIWK